ncbi:hypothetical protein SCHPADRAFT_120580 [Schizopora paradoxa]|uniref:Uncharacterized protein n=1 Tax=Schizopora paradoxa TaxID=27342 RepID=A0A0H2S9C0_9AGAM|nr:hypothetical protein SCHPADRAFT_120580 [Schizopora paradoxa]
MSHQSARAFAARSRFGSPTSCSSISGPLDVLVPIPSSPDLSYSQSSSPLPASSSPLRPPSLRMSTPDLPPSSPIASSPRSFWHVALNDGPGVPRRKPTFKQYSHVAPSLSPTDSAFSRDDLCDFFPSMKDRRRSSSESAPTLVSDVDPSEFSDDVDMIEDYSNQHSEDPFANVHAEPIVQMGYPDPSSTQANDSSAPIYSSHHRHISESKDVTCLSSDYDIATALLDLRRQVRISSKASSTPLNSLSTTFPSTSPEFTGPPIQRNAISHSSSHSLPTPLSSMNEESDEGFEAVLKTKPSSETKQVGDDIALSSVSVTQVVEVVRAAQVVADEIVELPMAAPEVSSSCSSDQLDTGELAFSELFRTPCADVHAKSEIESPADSPDISTAIDRVEDVSSCVFSESSEVCSDHVKLLESASSADAERSDNDAPANDQPQGAQCATSIVDDVCRVAGSSTVSYPVQSQDHEEVISEALASNSAVGLPSSTAPSTTTIEEDISYPQLPLLAIEDRSSDIVDASGRKGKQRVKDDENSEQCQSKKRRRRPTTTVLSESLVMNSRSTSPSLSDTSSLSPLSEDEEVIRERQPAKKRRRKEGRSKSLAVSTGSKGRGTAPLHTSTTGQAESEPSTSSLISHSETSLIDASVKAEMRGFLIQAMGLSRASSMPASSLLREVLREQPQLAHQRTKAECLSLIEDTLANAPGCTVFGRIDRSGMDAADKPLEAQWFYIPEMDEDKDRAALLQDMMPKKKRTAKDSSIRSKQYYYRPLGKLSRWDAEEDA